MPPTGSTVMFGGAPSCPKCTKSVYFAEQVLGPTGMWHKSCLKCPECKKTLNAGGFVTRGIEPYCKPCYNRTFGPQGTQYYELASPISPPSAESATSVASNVSGASAASTAAAASAESGSSAASVQDKLKEAKPADKSALASLGKTNNICSQCNKTVYAVELVSAAGRSWHHGCLRCCSCKRTLKSNELTDTKEGDIFCKNCYAREKGPHGFRAGSTTVNLDAPR